MVADELARTVSVRVDERGDGPVSALAASAAELQLLGRVALGHVAPNDNGARPAFSADAPRAVRSLWIR